MQELTISMIDGEVVEEGKEEKPIVNTPALRAAVQKEFKVIEGLQSEIKEKGEDIKAAINRLINRGLPRKAIKISLARRKMAASGELESVDEALDIICNITALGIQGELFSIDS